MSSDIYKTRVYAFTKKRYYEIKISKKFINSDDEILIIDDFLANGCSKGPN